MLAIIIQYLLSPTVFLLTFIPPLVFYIVRRRYVWFSILLTVMIEVITNWANFRYYESRGLMILFTLSQITVMAILIVICKAIGPKIKR